MNELEKHLKTLCDWHGIIITVDAHTQNRTNPKTKTTETKNHRAVSVSTCTFRVLAPLKSGTRPQFHLQKWNTAHTVFPTLWVRCSIDELTVGFSKVVLDFFYLQSLALFQLSVHRASVCELLVCVCDAINFITLSQFFPLYINLRRHRRALREFCSWQKLITINSFLMWFLCISPR